MKKEYTFDANFNDRIEDLWQTAICKYLNNDQYKYFKDTKKELVKEFKDIIDEIENKAKRNSIKYMEAELKRYVKDYKLKTLSDLDKVIDDTYKYIDGPGSWAVYCIESNLKDFCIDYPEIAKKYIKIEAKY